MEFVIECLKYCDLVVMLLRSNFLASRGRAAFVQSHAPDVYLLPNRPSFDGKGSDSTEYGWLVWNRADLLRSTGRLTVLNTTSASEIKAYREALLTKAA